jgi:hypothetical protein
MIFISKLKYSNEELIEENKRLTALSNSVINNNRSMSMQSLNESIKGEYLKESI